MLTAAVIQTHCPGRTRIDNAIGIRNSDENGFSMPPLQPTIHDSDSTSTNMCVKSRAGEASRGTRARHVA